MLIQHRSATFNSLISNKIIFLIFLFSYCSFVPEKLHLKIDNDRIINMIEKKKSSILKKAQRASGMIFNPARQCTKNNKRKSTGKLVNLLSNHVQAGADNFLYTQQAMALSDITVPKYFAIAAINPVYLAALHPMVRYKQKKLTKLQGKLNEASSEIPKEAILSRNQIAYVVTEFEKYLAKNCNIDGTEITEYCKQLESILTQERRMLQRAFKEQSRINSGTYMDNGKRKPRGYFV